GSSRPGADVGKKQPGADLGGQFQQVVVAPRRSDAAKQRRFGPVLVPAQPGAIAIGNLHVWRVPAALLDQRALWIVEQLPGRDRLAQVPNPPTHPRLLAPTELSVTQPAPESPCVRTPACGRPAAGSGTGRAGSCPWRCLPD